MALDRKDVRAKLDDVVHQALKLFARLDGITEAEFIERIVVPVVERRIADANLAAAELARLGIIGNNRESLGRRR